MARGDEVSKAPDQAQVVDERLRKELGQTVARFVNERLRPAGEHLRRAGEDPTDLLRGLVAELRSLADRLDPDTSA
jgi:hypothetical protein